LLLQTLKIVVFYHDVTEKPYVSIDTIPCADKTWKLAMLSAAPSGRLSLSGTELTTLNYIEILPWPWPLLLKIAIAMIGFATVATCFTFGWTGSPTSLMWPIITAVVAFPVWSVLVLA
jgi:hypothetical protein